ncbi:MAG: peptide ABC transporter permease [Candidatus Marinimicrobia bacterium]|nr:peptide ABC transporter permease [Candidatus Neomarinimicrobiota bacterium]|tara:strand:+ start:5455 stop:6387 length:933 start_codon:yes stop_codon:yes gene_type:complete
MISYKEHGIVYRWINGVFQNTKAIIGTAIICFFIFLTTLGPLFSQDPTAFLSTPLSPPSGAHWLGTNGQGQDVLAQTISGGRQTLLVGFTVGISVVIIGALIGGISGYYGGRIDDLLSLLINVFLVMPGLPLMVILASWLPPGPSTLIGVLVLTGWAWNARIIRSQMMTYRNRDFVSAAIMSGERNIRIIVIEIMPRMLSLLASSFIGASIYAIGAQVGLEFLGLGDVSTVTWGTNLYWASNDLALLTGSWWTFMPTGLSIAIVSFALTLINFGIDEISNPRLISERIWLKKIPKEDAVNGITPVIEYNE